MVTLGHLQATTTQGSGHDSHAASVAESRYVRDVPVPETTICVDCGGACHRIGYAPDEGFAPGDIVAFRCEDCLDRWDIVMSDEDDAEIARGDQPDM